MIEKDYILRQVHQLVQALAAVLFNKKAGRQELAEDHLMQALRQVFKRDLDQLRAISRSEIIDLCSPGGAWSGDLALALADLLREDGASRSHERAVWLYEAALESGVLVPLDVHQRIEALREPEGL